MLQPLRQKADAFLVAHRPDWHRFVKFLLQFSESTLGLLDLNERHPWAVRTPRDDQIDEAGQAAGVGDGQPVRPEQLGDGFVIGVHALAVRHGRTRPWRWHVGHQG